MPSTSQPAIIASSIRRMATGFEACKIRTARRWKNFCQGSKGQLRYAPQTNPIGSENMTGLARVIRGHAVTAYEGIALWHERDISHSSAEAHYCGTPPYSSTTLLNRFGNIVKNLTVSLRI